MKCDELFESKRNTRTVFQRKNGELRALQIPVEKLDTGARKPHPMFPIVKDRDAPAK